MFSYPTLLYAKSVLMVKYSQYNVRIPMSANTDVLYNTASDKFIAIRRNTELKDISELSESLTQLLLDNQMIVPEELDERGEVIAQWEKRVKSETDFFGTITIAGQNINDYNLKWWRQHCGVVMQDGVIFSESIGRNIAVGDGDVDVGRLEQAARIANIHDYVMSLPLKYNTLVGRDGVGLSQGQKQRILIARAVYKNPDFIFLDEATNSLDAKNERAIVENLDRFYKGRTVVVVAHRLSTVRNADCIIVIDRGKVVETGDHASLIARRGAYYNLVRNQLELGT